ncbi:MAG: PH domain-containing protein [Candidatus Nomurabacteria bacterium]|jgi:uncharacterized membrane protein YdbT with pleckstrin-like domain|nr:PH domain-containing protein [Candidatus Nomurabacteria bacterium]
MSKYYYRSKRDIVGLLIGITCWIVGGFAFYGTVYGFAQLAGEKLSSSDTTFALVSYSIMAFIGIAISVIAIYARTFSVLLIGQDKIIHKYGWLTKNERVIPAHRIRTCSKHQGVLGRLCDSIDISITTSGDSSEIYFRCINATTGDNAYVQICKMAGIADDDRY